MLANFMENSVDYGVRAAGPFRIRHTRHRLKRGNFHNIDGLMDVDAPSGILLLFPETCATAALRAALAQCGVPFAADADREKLLSLVLKHVVPKPQRRRWILAHSLMDQSSAMEVCPPSQGDRPKSPTTTRALAPVRLDVRWLPGLAVRWAHARVLQASAEPPPKRRMDDPRPNHNGAPARHQQLL